MPLSIALLDSIVNALLKRPHLSEVCNWLAGLIDNKIVDQSCNKNTMAVKEKKKNEDEFLWEGLTILSKTLSEWD